MSNPVIKPKALEGFEHVNRYWDKTRKRYAAKILPGEYYVTTNDEYITTVLGSCISACVFDTALRIGGMNHFMLPQSEDGEPHWDPSDIAAPTRYGNYAMEHLVNEILSRGGSRKRLDFKLFGGGKIIRTLSDVGERNIRFVKNYVTAENLKVLSEDLGGPYPRKVLFDPQTGKAWVKRLESMHNNTIINREIKYMNDVKQEKISGEVELF